MWDEDENWAETKWHASGFIDHGQKLGIDSHATAVGRVKIRLVFWTNHSYRCVESEYQGVQSRGRRPLGMPLSPVRGRTMEVWAEAWPDVSQRRWIWSSVWRKETTGSADWSNVGCAREGKSQGRNLLFTLSKRNAGGVIYRDEEKQFQSVYGGGGKRGAKRSILDFN